MAGQTILVVDDDKEILELLERSLGRNDYKVVKADTGGEAIEKARQNIPDLILMDIVLPDIEGAEAVRTILEENKGVYIPVLFLSGIVSGTDEMEPVEIRVGKHSYNAIGKPFSEERLLSKIRSVLI